MRLTPLLPVLSLCSSFLAASPAMLAAQQLSPAASPGNRADFDVAFRFGTLGLGIEASKLLTDHLGVRAGANFVQLNHSQAESDVTYNASLKMHAVTGLIDLYPGSRGLFHLTAGVCTSPVNVSANGQPTGSGTFDLNHHTYTNAQVGTLLAEAKFPTVSPYAGLGFGTPRSGRRVAMLFDVGAVLGKATVALSSTGAPSNSQLMTDLRAQQDSTQHDLDKYAKAYPVVALGLAVRF